MFVKVAQAYLQAKMRHGSETSPDGAVTNTRVPVHQAANHDLNPMNPSFVTPAPSSGLNPDPANGLSFNDLPVPNFSDAEAEQQYLSFMDPQDWYSSNASLYSLLEYDLGEISDGMSGFVGTGPGGN